MIGILAGRGSDFFPQALQRLGGQEALIIELDQEPKDRTPDYPALAQALAGLIKKEGIGLLIGEEEEGPSQVLANLHFETDSDLYSGLSDFDLDSNSLRLRKPALDGQGLVEMDLDLGGGGLNILLARGLAGSGASLMGHKMLSLKSPRAQGYKVLESRPKEASSLAQADLVLAAGRGLRDPQALEDLAQVAQALGGALAGSRPMVEGGYLDPALQVGQSGTQVAPTIYLALGISGAIQHRVGMKASDKVIAVNTNPSAAMVAQADYALIQDAGPLVQALKEVLLRH